MKSSENQIRVRKICDDDLGKAVELLAKGFARRSRQFWFSFLQTIAKRNSPEQMPRYGYFLETDGVPVGILLLLSTMYDSEDGQKIRCNVSSWYVEPHYRLYASLLSSQATKLSGVTYLNIDPATHTHAMLAAQGFQEYVRGQFLAIPALSSFAGEWPRLLSLDQDPDCPFESFERKLLIDHAGYGCISIWCVTNESAYPFVFVKRHLKRIMPCVQLVYCRSIDDLVHFARPLGFFLAKKGFPLLMVDANAAIPGLVGKYYEGVMPKYFKGAAQPRIGDSAYTETAMFGV
jgi:hypothetical protein